MKIIGKLVKILLGIVVLLLVALLALPLWIGPVVKGVANAVAPSKTGCAFELGTFTLNPYTGSLLVGDMRLANPTGFSPDTAVELGSLDVSVNVGSVLSDVVVVNHVLVRDVFVSYVFSSSGDTNFGVIQRNVKGPEAEKAPAEPEVGGEESKVAEEPAGPAKNPKKVIIDLVRLENVVVQFGPLKVPVPTITLQSIGRDTGGSTWSEVWQKISEEVLKHAGALGKNIKHLSAGLKDFGVKSTQRTTEAVSKGVGVATDAVGKGVGTATDAVGKGANVTTEAVSKGVGTATDAVSKGANATTEAVGKGVDSATKALKGLFK